MGFICFWKYKKLSFHKFCLHNSHAVSQHFKTIYVQMQKNRTNFMTTYKPCSEPALHTVHCALNAIIPFEFYGCKNNQIQFHKLVDEIMSVSTCEQFISDKTITKWKTDRTSWLVGEANNINTLRKLLVWLIPNFIIPKVILSLFKIVKEAKTRRIFFIEKSKYQSSLTLVLKDLIKNGKIVAIDQKSKPQAEFLRSAVIASMQLCIFNGSLKPLIHVTMSGTEKNMGKFVKKILLGFCDQLNRQYKIYENNFFTMWNKITDLAKGSKVWAMKVDLSNAFGNVNTELLLQQLRFCFNNYNHEVEPHLVQTYLKAVQHNIENIVVAFRNRKSKLVAYKLNRGLIHGHMLSGVLFNLQRICWDIEMLKPLLIHQDTFLLRYIDDYMICSLNMERVKDFYRIMNENESLNISKTESNLPGFDSKVLHFIGRSIDMSTLQVQNDNICGRHLHVIYRYQPTKHSDQRYLQRCIRYSPMNYYFSETVINLCYNSVSTTLANYFEAMIVVALKLDAGIKLRFGVHLPACTFRVIKTAIIFNSRVCQKTLDKHADKHCISKQHFVLLGLRAFICVFKKRSGVYKQLLQKLGEYRRDTEKRYHLTTLSARYSKIPKHIVNINYTRSLAQIQMIQWRKAHR